MKRKITFLTAALALLAFLAIPMGMRAAEGDVHDMNITQSTLLNNNAAIPSINIAAQSYSVNKVTINWRYNKAIENPVTIEVLVGEDSWGTQTITGNTTADAVFEGESTIGAIVINFTNNTGDGTGHGTFYVNSVKLTEGESSGPAPTTYTVTFDAGDGTFVGNTDFPNASNSVTAGTYTLPSATPATGYTFDGWAMGETTYQAGASYTVSGNADFVASYTENTTPTPGGPDVLNWAATGSPTNYTDWTYTAPSGAVYKGQSSGSTTGQYIQLRSNNNNSGIVTTTSAGKVTNISVTWNSSTTSGRTLNVYGKNSAYSAATDLYGNNAGTLIGTIVYGTSTELIITDDYEYIGMRSASGAMYLDEIQITWESVTPALVATPTFNPASGAEFGNDGLQVTITCETTGARIYYTLDGSTPDDGSNYYQSAITLTETTTIKAIAYDSDDNISSVATATYTYIDPNGPGTENNPYTVAQARAAIDAGTGTQGVYATGIVSAIPTAYNSTYGNVTFNMVDEEGDEVFLQAYRCGGDEAANVAVGDVAVVYGNLIKYGSTYEFGQDCEVVSLTHPVITTPVVTVTPNTIDAPAEGDEGTLAITYDNIPNLISFDIQFCDANGGELTGDDPDWINAAIEEEEDTYSVAYTIDANDGEARTAYFKVYTPEAEDVYAIVTVSQAEYVAPALDYAELPFEFDGGKADIETTDGLTHNGLGSDYSASPKLKFDTTDDWMILHFNEQPGVFSFVIRGTGSPSFSGTFTVETSVDGVDYETLATYTELGDAETMTFNNLDTDVRYIRWYFTEKVSGCNVGVGNIHLYEFGGGPAPEASITVNPDEVNVDAEEHDGTLALTYENLTITDMDDFDIQFCDANGDELSEEPDWIEVLVAEQDPEIGEGYVVSYYMFENEGEARSAYFKVYAMDDETNLVYSNLVTISQAAPVVPATPGTWVLTDLADLTENDVFVIVGTRTDETYGGNYAMPNDNGTSNPPAAVAVTVTEGTLSGEPAANLQWNISITEDGYTFYPNGETETWLYCTNTNNGVRVGTGEAKHFTLDEGYLTTTETTDQRYIGIYNSQDWRCYKLGNEGTFPANIANQTFAFYKKVETLPANSIVIEGYENNPNPNGGWYLIASPFAVDPDDVPGMTQGDFDLYSFTDMEEAEWRNYEAEGGHFNLEPGKGYLYAHKTGVTLTFDGEPYTGDGEITLTRNENNTGAYQGWNLVGNPFTETAYIEVDRDFYVMNEAGTNVVLNESNNRTIAPMQGIFVKAEQDGETMKFLTEGTATAGDIDQKIVMNVRKDRNMVIDRAMIRFGEGRQLPKFMFNPDDTKLYIAKDNEEFAVVRSIDENSTPISFRAAEDGTYTLSVNVENVEMEYLHLIDNMTSADIDLLATPSYTFDARTTDYTSRFNLVYATYDDVNENTTKPFAFFDGSEWVINNAGNAILQVVDVTGRVLSSETLNGYAHISLDQVPGVYVMRLVSGNDMKVQKVIIK